MHDSYAAGYIETWKDPDVRNAFYISLSNSVGGSFIVDHEIYAGDTQKGGEIGHMAVVPENGELCYCGKYGCFDTVCRAGKLDEYTNGNLEEFFYRLGAGDERAAALWDVYLDHLASQSTISVSCFSSVKLFGRIASAFLAVHGIIDTITVFLPLAFSGSRKYSLITADIIPCGDLQVDKFGI